MAGSVNKVILVGNLGRAPEVRHSQDGNKIVNMSLATSESWKDKDTGEIFYDKPVGNFPQKKSALGYIKQTTERKS